MWVPIEKNVKGETPTRTRERAEILHYNRKFSHQEYGKYQISAAKWMSGDRKVAQTIIQCFTDKNLCVCTVLQVFEMYDLLDPSFFSILNQYNFLTKEQFLNTSPNCHFESRNYVANFRKARNLVFTSLSDVSGL